MHHGIYIMECIWLSFWILQKKVGISFYFWIFRLVNSQLALYSHVRCNPFDISWHPQSPQNTPHMTITNFNYEDSYGVRISFYFWIIRLVNTHHCTVMSDVTHLTSPGTPITPKTPPTWQLQISTMRVYICQVYYVILLLKLILANLPPKCIMEYISW